MEEKDLTKKENNPFIPNENEEEKREPFYADPEAEPELTKEEMENPLIPDDCKPKPKANILKRLDRNDVTSLGRFIIQRKHRHAEGDTGGEFFLLSKKDGEGIEKKVTLSQLAEAKSEQDLEALF